MKTTKTHSATDNETATQFAQKNYMSAIYLFMSAFLCISWTIGILGGSLVWVFILSICLYTIWRVRISSVVKLYMKRERSTLDRKRALKHCESAEWLNFIINRWWVYSSSCIQDAIRKRLNDRLFTIRPRFIRSLKLSSFDLGEQTPFIKDITMMEYEEGQPGGKKTISYTDVLTPPKGLATMSKYNIVLDAEVALLSEDFAMIFSSHIGNSKCGFDVDLAVENMNITGNLQIILQLSMDVPFPHFSKATAYFIQRPELWFNIRCLNYVQLMEIPLLSAWLHTHIMEGLTDALVDPGKIDISLGKPAPKSIMSHGQFEQKLACGVLTISVRCSSGSKVGVDDVTYLTMKVASTKHGSREILGPGKWEHTASFMVYDLGEDSIILKYKLKRLLYGTTLQSYKLPLSSYGFPIETQAEKLLDSPDGTTFHLTLDFTPLAEIDVSITAERPINQVPHTSCGVVYVKLHGASGLIAGDQGDTSDPYAVLFCDRKKVFTTPYVMRTKSPTWECGVEFFVSDFSKKTYSIHIYDWDGVSAMDDDFLGTAFFTMSMDEPIIIRRMLTLGYNNPSQGYVEKQNFGIVCVSAVFRPVASVCLSAKYEELDGHRHNAVPEQLETSNTDSVTKAEVINDFKERLLEDKMFVELNVICARHLVAGDRSGSSDPYVDVSVGNTIVYKTAVKKKTLNPTWNEIAAFNIAKDQTVEINVYDKDFIGKDFLGRLELTVEALKVLYLEEQRKWFPLQKTKSGEIQLSCSITSKDSVDKNKKTSKLPAISITDYNDNLNDSINSAEVIEPEDGDNDNQDWKQYSKSRNGNSPTDSSVDQKESFPMMAKIRPIPEQSHNSNYATLKNQRLTVSTKNLEASDMYYDVKGRIVQLRGYSGPPTDMYCRVRLDRKHGHGQGSLRTIAKSVSFSSDKTVNFNLGFEINKGHGVPKNALVIIDIKSSKKEILATQCYMLRDIIGDSPPGKAVYKWMLYRKNMDLEVTMTHSSPDPDRYHRPGLLRKLSFTRRSHQDLQI